MWGLHKTSRQGLWPRSSLGFDVCPRGNRIDTFRKVRLYGLKYRRIFGMRCLSFAFLQSPRLGQSWNITTASRRHIVNPAGAALYVVKGSIIRLGVCRYTSEVPGTSCQYFAGITNITKARTTHHCRRKSRGPSVVPLFHVYLAKRACGKHGMWEACAAPGAEAPHK